MTEPLLIEATDPAVIARTIEAHTHAVALGLGADVAIRCAGRKCGRKLALVGTVPGYGPMFVTRWTVPDTTAVDGVEMPTRLMLASMAGQVTRHGPLDWDMSTKVLLVLPPDMAQDNPPPFVRCVDHGDAVLSRAEVIAWRDAAQRRGRGEVDRHVRMGPRLEVVDPVIEWPGRDAGRRDLYSVRIAHTDPRTTTGDELR